LLIERPSYGYELAKRFERVYGGLLSVSAESHVYAALNVLEERGLIEVAETDPPSAARSSGDLARQPKLRYRATQAGERGFFDWVLAGTCEDRVRWRIFVQQLSVAAVRNARVAFQILDGAERCYRAETHACGADALAAAGHRTAGRLAADLIARERQLTLDGRLRWVEDARTMVAARAGR
jgi:DNA-binding PadR family transcriptional regulator